MTTRKLNTDHIHLIRRALTHEVAALMALEQGAIQAGDPEHAAYYREKSNRCNDLCGQLVNALSVTVETLK
jgi:hypothetical protein